MDRMELQKTSGRVPGSQNENTDHGAGLMEHGAQQQTRSVTLGGIEIIVVWFLFFALCIAAWGWLIARVAVCLK